MDSFNLLKHWRSAARGSTSAAEAVALPVTATDGEETDDEGSFFDLEFAAPDDRSAEENRGGEGDEENELLGDDEDEKDFNFSMNESQAIPPSDELFFKGQLVPLESSSIVVAAGDSNPKAQLAVPLLKSATKFRVFVLGLRKSKSTTVESNAAGVSPKQSQLPSKLFFVNFKVEEVPIVSLFTRDSSSRNQAGVAKTMEKVTETGAGEDATVGLASSEEKMKSPISKEVVQKYLSKIKPLYVRVSKRYAEKLRFSGNLVQGQLPTTELGSEEEKVTQSEDPAELKMAEKMPALPAAELKIAEKNLKLPLPAKLRVAYERLGKSRSATSTVAAVSSPPPPPPQRHDDSLLQQQDGIQSAIAHCKRSFTAASKGAKAK